MTTAEFGGKVIAESDSTVVVEGNHYFPAESVKWDYFNKTEQTTLCPWKGSASYYSLSVDGEVADNAAWQYEEPLPDAINIKDHVAFYPAVKVS